MQAVITKSVLFFLLAFLSQGNAVEVSVNYEGKGNFLVNSVGKSPLRQSQIINIIRDVENQCMQGCYYYLPSIRETIIVDKISNDAFYTWTYVDDIMNAEFFSKIVVGKNSVTYSTPAKEAVRNLKSRKYKHKPIFYQRAGKWIVEEKFSSDGKFLHSQVTFHLKIKHKKAFNENFQ